ncbi:LIM domain-binding 2 isoform X1 [Brachionus plicatilis]|uniref:LIM domain-binding 2 isoform X1 n=1 Tax=Brachionus plicatilis TaxID=10195 RepID=A0A3M7S268_BRAPC|nr:LIM domain-binding 2 isoform X1 [Brachionus plicatilis]
MAWNVKNDLFLQTVHTPSRNPHYHHAFVSFCLHFSCLELSRDPAQGPPATNPNQANQNTMPEQQPTMPPQSPLVNHQANFAQQQQQWAAMGGQQQTQYQQFGNQRGGGGGGGPINQTNSSPAAPHQQMPPPGQPQSPIVAPMNPQVGMVPRTANFGHHPGHPPQFMHSQFNQIPASAAHHQYQAHGPHPLPPPPPPPPPPPQVINLPIQLQPEFRVYEMNRRLASRSDNLLVPSRHPHHEPNQCHMWYDSFVNEFFDDNARLNIRNVQEENVTKNYSLSRALIPRFFRSFSEDECMELSFQILRGHILSIANTAAHQQTIVYESDSCVMNCKMGRPMYAKLCVEGTLMLECVLEASMPQAAGSLILDTIKIKNFTFAIKRHQELIPRSAFCGLRDNNQLDKLSANIAKAGLVPSAVKYLKICSVLEPMQELMLRHKMSAQAPRECLRVWAMQRMGGRAQLNVNPPVHFQRGEETPPAAVKGEKAVVAPLDTSKNSSATSKRRKRKPSPNSSSPNEPKKETNAKTKKAASATVTAATTAASLNQSTSSSSPVFSFGPGYGTPAQLADVMVVGEPSLMGGDFGEEDERLITRLENNQFDSVGMKQSQFGQQRPGSFEHMMPPRPHSSSHFVTSSVAEPQARSLTPSPSTSSAGAPKTPTSQSQLVDLNLNGSANGNASAVSSSKSPSLANGAMSQPPQAPSNSTSTSAIASSSASLSPSSLYNSGSAGVANSGGANAAILSPGHTASTKQAQLNSGDQPQQNQQQTQQQQQQQQQQKSIFLSNF